MRNFSMLGLLFLICAHVLSAGDAPLKEDIDKLDTQRSDAIRSMIALVGDIEKRKSDPQLVGKAIVLLGNYRAVEAVSVLIETIDYDCSSMQWTPVGKMKISTDKKHIPEYSSVASLVKIGNHSVIPLLDLLKNVNPASSGSDFIRPRLALQVLLALLGRDRLETTLKAELASNSDQSVREHLALSIKTLGEMGDDPTLKKFAPVIPDSDSSQKE